MGGIVDAVKGIVGGIGDAISGVVSAVGGVVKGIGNAISGAVKAVGNTVSNILKNPIPTLLQIGGAMVGIPPYVTAAVITAAQGGKLEDIAKSAAVSYAGSTFLADTQIGADIKNYTSNAFAGDFTDSMMEKFNLAPDQAVQIAKIATSSMNSALVGGINAALTGKPIGQSIASGFTSGLVYASTDSYFDSVNKDPNWGFSDKALNIMKGATSTALNTIISGKGDPAQALGNYIAYATINMGGTSLLQSAKEAYKLLTTDTEAAKSAQDKYTTAKAEYDAQVKKGEALRNGINEDAATYQKVLDEQYNPFKTEYDKLAADNESAVNTFNEQKKIFDDNKWAYENYDAKIKSLGYEFTVDENSNAITYYRRVGGVWTEGFDTDTNQPYRYYKPDGSILDDDGYPTWRVVNDAPTQQSYADKANAAATAANAAADTATSTQTAAQKLYDDNKAMIDGLGDTKTAIDKKIADLQVIKKDVEDASVAGSTAATLKAAADAYQTKYDAWAKTKDAADRSAENYTKALAEVATRDATIDALNTGAIKVTSKDADGNWTLSNGMTLTSQGKFMQDGQQVFTNAAGIPQKVMDFTGTDGSKIDFDDNAGRVLSTTDVQNICKRDYGFTPTAAEAEKIAGGVYTDKATTPITELADQKAKDAYLTIAGKEPTAAELNAIRKSGDVVTTAQDQAINGLDLPSDYKFPDRDTKLSFTQAYRAERELRGPGKTFEWTNPETGVTGTFTTETAEEKKARIDKMLADSQSRINMMPASALTGAGRGFLNVNNTQQIINMMAGSNEVGGGRGFISPLNTQALIDMMPKSTEAGSGRGIFGGPPAGVENIYYGKKDGNVYVDTRTYDAMGNVTGGSLNLADDKTATAVRATNWIEQAQATGAQGVGELLQHFANAAALYTGSDMNNAVYNVGKAIEQWGKDRDGADILKQDANMESAVRVASLYKNPMDQARILFTAAKENPLSIMSSTGKEIIQEAPGWIAASIAGVFMAPMGLAVATTLTVKAAISAGLDALESMGAGGREVYDALRAKGVPENVAREKAMINGALHALAEAPAEFIADRLLLGHFVKGLETGVVNYAAKYGSTIATNALGETLAAIPQNLSTQYFETGKTNLQSATAGALYEGMIGGTTVTSMLGAKSINDAAIVAKDYAGNNVTLKELMDGSKIADLKTLDSSANIGSSNNGGDITLGALSAVGQQIGISPTELKSFLPSSVTDYSTVVYKAADGTAITLGNIDSILKKNPTLDFGTVLNDVYTTPSSEFKTVFNSSVLNGSSTLQSAKDYEDTARKAGFPSYAAYQQYGGDKTLYDNAQNTALAKAAGFPDYATYTQYNGDLTIYNAAKTDAANTLKATTAGFPDYASYTKYGGDVAAYNTAKTAEANTKRATDAGFPDYAAYTQYGGDIKAYNTAQTNAANLRTATTAGFPDFASYTQYGGDINAYNTAQTNAANLATAKAAGFPDYANYTLYKGDINAFNTANTNAANLNTAKAAGFPDYASYTQYNGDINAYNTAQTNATNLATAKAAGFPDYASYTQYNGDANAYKADTTAKNAGWKDAAEQTKASAAGYTDPTAYAKYLTDTANTLKATTAGFPDYATYTQYKGDKAAYDAAKATTTGTGTGTGTGVTMDAVTQAINTAIAGIKLPAGVSMDSVVTAIKNFATLNPSMSAADVTAAVKDYMAANPSITSADVNTAVTNATKNLATKADIATAIAGIKFPAGITAADVTTAIEDYMSKNAGLSAKDVTTAVATYMQNHPGITSTDVSTAITNAMADVATKKDIETAIANIKFPTGLTAADVATKIKEAMDANPGLTAADVTSAITTYMTNNPGVTAADVTKAVTDATKDFVTNKTFDTAIENLGADVKTKFDTLTQGQKDIVKAYTQQGIDINKAIADSAKLTTDQINTVKTQLSTLSGDVKTKFDSLTQGQKDIVNAQIKMGVDINKAIADAALATTEQIAGVKTDLTKNITNVQTQFNARVDELMLQGQTYQAATNLALKELGTGVSGLQTSVTDIQEQQKQAAKVQAAKDYQSKVNSGLSKAMALIGGTAAGADLVDTSTPGFKDIGYKTTGDAKFESILSPFEKMVKEGSYEGKPQQQTEQQTQQQLQQAAPVNQELDPQKNQQGESNYFNYGNSTEIDQMLGSNPGTQMLYSKAGGLATPLFAGGGSTRYGRYAGGGLPIVEHAGKARLDFRTGNAVTGPGDGQSDDIPAMLADGEFVFPADVVAALGNGSTKAGSDKLYDMMHSIRAYHRSAKPEDLPPPAKMSPLDYLKKPARKARR